MSWIHHIPKVELHRHLEGSIRLDTLCELARDLKIKGITENIQSIRNTFLILEPMKNLEIALLKFRNLQSILASEEILERISYEIIEDAYHSQIRVLELRYSPQFIHERHPHLSYEKIHMAILKGASLAAKTYSIAYGLIGLIARNDDVKIRNRVMDFIIENKETFIATDLADNELGFGVDEFIDDFQRAKKHGLHITIHAGEPALKGAAENIKASIDKLGAERIGHGVQAIHHPEIIDYLIEKQITLELCLTSNYLVQAVPSLEAHPIQKLRERGVKVTINTDDPGPFNISLNNEYEKLHKIFGFTEKDFKEINETALQASFIPDEKKFNAWKL